MKKKQQVSETQFLKLTAFCCCFLNLVKPGVSEKPGLFSSRFLNLASRREPYAVLVKFLDAPRRTDEKQLFLGQVR